jgi:choice-of-anchor A domain-containing protein
MVAAGVATTGGMFGGASVAQANILNTWNLMVFNNHQISSNVEGSVLVGGNLTGTGDVGTRLTPASNFLGQTTLLVGGNVNIGGIQLQAGNLRHGGTFSGNVNFNGGGNRAQSATAAATAQAARTQVLGISSFLASQSPTSTVNVPGSPTAVVINAVPRGDGVAIVSLPGAIFSSGNVQSFDLNFNGATSVIFNVSGTAVNITGGNFIGNLSNANNASRILWNFPSATSMQVQRQITGAFIAPGATVTNTSTIVGTTAVNNLTQNGQVHIPLYTGYIPAPGAVAVLGLAGLAAARRRR